MSSLSRSLRNKLLLPVVGGIVFYVLMIIWGDYEDLAAAFSNLKLSYLPVILTLAFLNYVLRYAKFQYYLRIIGIKLKHSLGFPVFLASFVMAITPGKLGEMLKSVFIKDLTGANKSRTAPIVVAERITDLLAFMVMTLLGISGFTQEKEMLVVIFVTFILIIVFCGLIGVRSFSMAVLNLISKLPKMERISPKLLMAYESTYILITPKRLLFAVFISVPSWSCEVFAFYLTCQALGSPIPLGAAFFIYSVGTILGAIAFLPGGLGLTEASIAGLLTKFIGMQKALAASATLLIRLCTLWFAVLLGGAVFFLYKNKLGGAHALEEAMDLAEENDEPAQEPSKV